MDVSLNLNQSVSGVNKRQKHVKVRRALDTDQLRKFNGIAEDSSAANYFKNSKQVLDLLEKATDRDNRQEIKLNSKLALSEQDKRSTSPIKACESVQDKTRDLENFFAADAESMGENPYQM